MRTIALFNRWWGDRIADVLASVHRGVIHKFMAVQTAPPRSQRLAVLTGVYALHGLALFALLASRGDSLPAPTATGALTVLTLSERTPSAAPPPPPALPSKLAEKVTPPRPFVVSNEPESTATGEPAAGCATLEVVTRALMADPATVEAVYRAPAETRSISGAVMLWNAGWNGAARTIDAPLGPVRATAEASLSSVGENCLEEAVVGPRLVPIAQDDQMMFVVFGSGIWRWRDLVSERGDPEWAQSFEPRRPAFEWPW